MLAEHPDLAVKSLVANNPPSEADTMVDLFAATIELPDHLVHELIGHIEE